MEQSKWNFGKSRRTITYETVSWNRKLQSSVQRSPQKKNYMKKFQEHILPPSRNQLFGTTPSAALLQSAFYSGKKYCTKTQLSNPAGERGNTTGVSPFPDLKLSMPSSLTTRYNMFVAWNSQPAYNNTRSGVRRQPKNSASWEAGNGNIEQKRRIHREEPRNNNP